MSLPPFVLMFDEPEKPAPPGEALRNPPVANEPLIAVTTLSIEPSVDDVETQRALITVHNLVKQ